MFSADEEAILMMPSSLMSTLAPDSSTISRITLPPEPITSRILSVGICRVSIFGAYSEKPCGAESDLFISPKICRRPSLACAKACFMMSGVMPAILMSICNEVMPDAVPATLKSMSPR